MRETYLINTNQSYTNWLWNYGKQAVKGLGVMGLGVLGYVGLRGYWRSDNTTSQTKTTDLVSATDESTSVIKKDLTNPAAPTSQNIWNSADQSLQYRRKREVVPVAGDFQVNTFIAGAGQQLPKVVSLSNGDFVITWMSYLQDGSGWGIYAQRFTSNGTYLGGEFRVNNVTNDDQTYPAIVNLANGGFVITWGSHGQDGSGWGIYARRFDNNGMYLGNNEFQVNSYTTNDQSWPAIASLSNSEFVITWHSSLQDGSGDGIYAQRFDISGIPLGLEFQANNYTANHQDYSAIAGLTNGEFVITWMSHGQDGSGYGIYAQHFASNDTRIGNEFQVNTFVNSDQAHPAIASLPNGEFVITWHSYGQDGSGYGIYAQRFAGNDTCIGNEFQVNTYINYDQTYPAIASLPNGEFVITWSSSLQDGSGWGIYAQRFAVNGIRIGNEFQVNSNTTGDQLYPAVAFLASNRFVTTWQGNIDDGSNYRIYARVFDEIYTPPQVIHNQLAIGQGQSVILNSDQLLTLSESVALDNLMLLTRNVSYGWFANVKNFTMFIVNFTQLEINNAQIQFTHDGSDNAPGYQIVVFDGFSFTIPQTAIIDFDRKPVWLNNQISIANNKQVRLSANELLTVDDRNNLQVFFEIGNINHGVFALSSSADPFAYPLGNFTQQQVNNSQINFVHDGSNIAPSCDIRASDGRLYTPYQPCQFIFIPNRPPQLTLNEVTLVKGEKKVIDGTSLAATDPDATTPSELGALLFNFTDIGRGQFELSNNPNVAVYSALQSQVAAGQLVFKHDDSIQAPSYNVTVSDGYVTTASQAAKVSFSLSNNNAVIGGAVGGTGAALLLAGAGIFGAYRYRRSKQLEAQRANYPLANALYHELKIPDTEDFQSEKGIAFTNAVDALNNELIRAGVDIKQMVPEEITELAAKLATATKAQLGKKINPLDIQDYAQGIVATAMTLSGKNLIDDTAVVELEDVRSIDSKDKVLLATMKEYFRENNIDLNTMSLNQVGELVKPLLASSKATQLTV